MFRIIHLTNDTTQTEAVVFDTEGQSNEALIDDYGIGEDDKIEEIIEVYEDEGILPTDRRLEVRR